MSSCCFKSIWKFLTMCVFPNNIYRAHRFFSSSIENRPDEGMVDQTISRYQFKQNPITRMCLQSLVHKCIAKIFLHTHLYFSLNVINKECWNRNRNILSSDESLILFGTFRKIIGKWHEPTSLSIIVTGEEIAMEKLENSWSSSLTALSTWRTNYCNFSI